MATGGWQINLSGSAIPVFRMKDNGSCSTTKIGTIYNNECFAEGTNPSVGWEGVDNPVDFLDANHNMQFGVYSGSYRNLVDFADYASNGSTWERVTTGKRRVQYPTRAYYADGSKCCDLPAGSYVWLTRDCSSGRSNPNYCSVSKVQTAAGKTYTFSGCGFIDLTYGGKFVNARSILLRKA